MMRRSIVSSDEIIHYTLEEKKRTKSRCNRIATYVVAIVSHPMNATNHPYVVLYWNRNDQPYVLDSLDVRYILQSSLTSSRLKRNQKANNYFFYRHNIVKKKTFCFFFISNSKTTLKIIIKIDVDLIQGLISVLLNRCLHINIFR